eukprot:s1698_g2.t1
MLGHGFTCLRSFKQAAQSDLAAELQKAKDEAATIERELSASLHTANVARDQLQSQIDVLAAKVEEKDREVTDLANAAQATKADLMAQLKAAREEAASNLKAKLSGGEAADRLQRKVAELEVANDELQASKTDVESQLKSREEAVEGLQSRLADLEAKKKHFEDLVSMVRNEAEEKRRDLEDAMKESQAAVQEAKAQLVANRAEAETKQRELTDSLGSAKASAAALEQQLASQQEQAETKQRELASSLEASQASATELQQQLASQQTQAEEAQRNPVLTESFQMYPEIRLMIEILHFP